MQSAKFQLPDILIFSRTELSGLVDILVDVPVHCKQILFNVNNILSKHEQFTALIFLIIFEERKEENH